MPPSALPVRYCDGQHASVSARILRLQSELGLLGLLDLRLGAFLESDVDLPNGGHVDALASQQFGNGQDL